MATPGFIALTRVSLLSLCAIATPQFWAAPLWASDPGAGADWSRFRGPGGHGVSQVASIPSQFTPAHQRFKVKLAGEGHSSPVVLGDRIVVTSTDKRTAQRFVQCLSAADGSTMWTQSFESLPYKQHAFNSFASSTPAVDDQAIYLTWTSGSEVTLLSLDWAGKLRWKADLGDFAAAHGSGISPVLAGSMVILYVDKEQGESFIVGMHRDTGREQWRLARKTSKATYGTPSLWRPTVDEPEQLIIASHAHGFTSIDPTNGKINWELAGIMPERVVASPFITPSGLMVATCGAGGGGKAMVIAQPGTQANGMKAKVLHTFNQRLPYVPTPVADKERLYLWNEQGIVTAINLADGSTVWSERIPDTGRYFTSPLLIADRLYSANDRGQMVVLRAGEKYELLAVNDLGEPTNATPAIAHDRLYIRTLNHLICIDGNVK